MRIADYKTFEYCKEYIKNVEFLGGFWRAYAKCALLAEGNNVWIKWNILRFVEK